MEASTADRSSNSSKIPVTVTLSDLENGRVSFETLKNAFGPLSLGILLVKDLPQQFLALRESLLSYASYLANLAPHELEQITDASSHYLSGWSHGKESLKNGKYDHSKGSFYVNCSCLENEETVKRSSPPEAQSLEMPAANLWPDETVLPGFRQTCKELCAMIQQTGILVARACDRYISAEAPDYPLNYLEQVVRHSVSHKARLLHYFPQDITLQSREPNDDSWCATHVDHGCLTGLTAAIYIDEVANPPTARIHASVKDGPLPSLTSLSNPPDPSTGLYIHARDGGIVKISFPPDQLAFQTGEALELITRGRFKAVPHFVKAHKTPVDGAKISRNTLALFMQPNLEDIVDTKAGTTFGDFSRTVLGRFSGPNLHR